MSRPRSPAYQPSQPPAWKQLAQTGWCDACAASRTPSDCLPLPCQTCKQLPNNSYHKLQHTVALSSTEAEYLALSAATREALYLRNLLRDLCPDAAGTVTLYEDNQSTIKQASNVLSSDRTKHIDIRHHFVKSHVANGDIVLEYLPTAEQPADALTKSLDRVKVASFRQLVLGLSIR